MKKVGWFKDIVTFW